MRERWRVLAALAGLIGCSGEEQPQDSDVEEAEPFECAGFDLCEAGSEFCLESWQGDGRMAGTCAPLQGCADCDCLLEGDIEQIWHEQVGETDNCSGALLLCEQSDAAILVICQK